MGQFEIRGHGDKETPLVPPLKGGSCVYEIQRSEYKNPP